MQAPEKRSNVRRTVRYPGTIEAGGDSAPRQCTLCDASEEGAQITVDDPASVPASFTLVLGYDGTARRNCLVVWRSDTQIGVKFAGIQKNLLHDTDAAAADPDASSGLDDSLDADSLPSR